MEAPRLRIQGVTREDLDNTLFDWLADLSADWESGLTTTPPNQRAAFAFGQIVDPGIRVSLLRWGPAGGPLVGTANQAIEAMEWTTFCVLLSMYIKGMHRRAENGNDMSQLQRVAQYVRQNPVAGVALTVAGAAVVGPALLVGGLNLLGFSAAGPVAGSIAAALQSTFYGGAVASGSLFALAQSAAMGGIAVAGVGMQIAGVSALTLGGAALHQGRQAATTENGRVFGPNDVQQIQDIRDNWNTAPRYNGPQAHQLSEWLGQRPPLRIWIQDMSSSFHIRNIPQGLRGVLGYSYLGPLVHQDFEESVTTIVNRLGEAGLTFDWEVVQAGLKMHAAGYLREELRRNRTLQI